MPILHTSWSPAALPGGVMGVRPGALWQDTSDPGTFNSDPYLKRLNMILRRELAASELYQVYCTKIRACPDHEAIAEGHLNSAKTLQNLIIYHRGLPVYEGFSLTSELPLVTLQLAAYMPGRLSTVAAFKSCERMEQWLLLAYRRTIKGASVRDRGILQELLAAARANLKVLRQPQL